MSPDSSFSSPSSSTGGVQSRTLFKEPAMSSSVSPYMSAPVASSTFIAPLNLQKYERAMELHDGHQHHQHYQSPHMNNNKPTAIATAVIRVQVPECNSSGLVRHTSSPPPTLIAVSTNDGNGSNSPFMVPQPAAMYSNVIVMNKKPKPHPQETAVCPSPSSDYAKSYPVMEPTVASSSHSNNNSSASGANGASNNSNSYNKGEPELNIGMTERGRRDRRRAAYDNQLLGQ